jgi:two-component system, NarL family, response regulator DevR
MVPRTRVFLADELALMRDGLRALLNGEFAVVGEAAEGQQVVEAARRARPHVMVMDAHLQGMTGIDAARRLAEELPEVRILILTAASDARTVQQCLQAGVRGYVLKDVETAELKRHIRTIARGESVLDSRVAGMVMAQFRRDRSGAPARAEQDLTGQQMAILGLMSRGCSNRAIAEQLHLSENTIKGYTSEILHRLGVKNRVEAAAVASQRGWV